MKKITVRELTVTAMLSAVASVLMLFHFNLPFMPSFISFDVADLPPLLASFAIGPVYGAVVCFMKNFLHILLHSSHTMFVGELSNFILSCAFVVTAGLIYQKQKTRKKAIIASLCGALAAALVGVISNYYLIYPLFGVVYHFSKETILGMYQAILPGVKNLWQALVIFNLPFTFVKGLCSALIAFAIYKPLSPILKGRKQ